MKVDRSAPADTSEMRIAHSAMRRELVRFRVLFTTPDAITPDRREAVEKEVDWFIGYVLHHHHGEDTELYPKLPLTDRVDRELIRDMGREHEAIHPPMDALAEVADRFGAGQASEAEMLEALGAFETPFLAHLAREEREAMPIVERLWTQGQWMDMTQKAWLDGLSMPKLGAFGMWILDSQLPEDAATMEATLPRIQVFVLKRLFGGSYRRRAERLWGGTPAEAVPALTVEAREAWSPTTL